MENKKGSDESTDGIIIFSIFILAFQIVFTFLSFFVGFSSGQKRKKSYTFFAITPYLLALVYLIGIPYIYHPSHSSIHFFSFNNPDSKKYMANRQDVIREIDDIEDDIKSHEESIRDYRKSMATDNDKTYYKRRISKEKERIESYKKELVVQYDILDKVNFKRTKKFEFYNFVKDSSRKFFKKHSYDFFLVYLFILATFIIGYQVGIAVGTKKEGKIFNALSKISSLLCFHAAPLSFIFERYITSDKNSLQENSSEASFEFGDGEGFLTDKNLSLHTQVVGGSGSGKTNFIKSLIENRIREGKGVVFLDYKADFEVLSWMQGLCENLGRTDLKIMSLSDSGSSIPYNPIREGNPTEITSQIVNSLEWSESYYKNYSENIILMATTVLCHSRDYFSEYFHIGHLLKIITDYEFRSRMTQAVLKSSEDQNIDTFKIKEAAIILNELSDKRNIEKLSGLITQLRKIVHSSAGSILTESVEKYESLNLGESILNGDIVYLYMNSMSLKDVASSMGKMILQDLMKEVGRLYSTPSQSRTGISVIIDEFASFATPDFINFLDKARGANIEIVVSHQSMSDLKDISENFGIRILENTASKVIFNTQNSDDAELFASIPGTYETFEYTNQVERSLFGKKETGLGTRKVVEKFNVHPNQFKSLSVGQAIVICNKADQHYGFTNIYKCRNFIPQEDWKRFQITNIYYSYISLRNDKDGNLDNIVIPGKESDNKSNIFDHA